ncbi:MAG: DUF3592 domain-containing protein [Candidatus Odinarchaeota archaeon]
MTDLVNLIVELLFVAFLGLFGTIFVLGGSYGLYSTVKMIKEAIATYRWPRTDGKVTATRIDTESGDESTYYIPVITYSYTVGEKQYQSERLRISVDVSGREGWAGKMVKKYAPGKSVSVHYNRDSPEKAVIEYGLNLPVIIYGFIGLISLGIGLLVLWFCLQMITLLSW